MTYEYVAQVLAMPSCTVTMELVSPCQRYFRAEDGREFYIGSPGADRQVTGFLGSLKEDEVYHLPQAFMEYLERLAERRDR